MNANAKNQKIVISASRRTDIPAFYMDWFMQRIETGTFETINPYNRKLSIREATPEKVHTIVFWSKNFAPFIKNKYDEALIKKGYNLFFNFTINSRDNILEPNLPSLTERINQLEYLAATFGPESVNWRFDPICQYKTDDRVNNNLGDFEYIAEKVSRANISRCITSFADIYKKIHQRLKTQTDTKLIDMTLEEKIDAVLRMKNSLASKGINLMLCCESNLLDSLPLSSNISASSCINNRLLQSLYGDGVSLAKDTGQRTKTGCDCKKSFDIGSYELHPCMHNCLYCYANPVKVTSSGI